jgi:hypothetical protein
VRFTVGIGRLRNRLAIHVQTFSEPAGRVVCQKVNRTEVGANGAESAQALGDGSGESSLVRQDDALVPMGEPHCREDAPSRARDTVNYERVVIAIKCGSVVGTKHTIDAPFPIAIGSERMWIFAGVRAHVLEVRHIERAAAMQGRDQTRGRNVVRRSKHQTQVASDTRIEANRPKWPDGRLLHVRELSSCCAAPFGVSRTTDPCIIGCVRSLRREQLD